MSDEFTYQTANCEKHGEYQQKVMEGFLPGKKIVTGRCPKCLEETNRVDQAYEQEQKKIAKSIEAAKARALLKNDTPPRFLPSNFNNYELVCPEAEAALKICQSYAEKFDHIAKNGAGIVLCGTVGTGKTHLALSIAKCVVESGITCRYFNLGALVREIRDTWSRDSIETETQVLKRLHGYGLLIIDEIGVQNGTENERNIAFDVINGRYEKMLPTIIISNLSRGEVGELISERSVSRITDGGGAVITFTWEDYRNRGAA